MTDLDEKLEEILGLYRRDIERHYGGRTIGKTLTGDEAVNHIKQAFKDAGYIKPKIVLPTKRLTCNNCHRLVAMTSLMTGQEWYEKFNESLADTFSMKGDFKEGYKAAQASSLEAARRASGIEQ